MQDSILICELAYSTGYNAAYAISRYGFSFGGLIEGPRRDRVRESYVFRSYRVEYATSAKSSFSDNR